MSEMPKSKTNVNEHKVRMGILPEQNQSDIYAIDDGAKASVLSAMVRNENSFTTVCTSA
jgi:hypothetical protein